MSTVTGPGPADFVSPARLAGLWLRRLRLAAGLREVALLAILWTVYSASRLLADDDLPRARRRAGDIIDVERFLHLDPESWLNHAVAPVTQLAVPLSYWYASLHYVVTPAVLVFLFFRRPADYPRARSALVIGTALGLTVYMLMPTAPPRLMPGGQYDDVLARTDRYGWWSTQASAPAGLGHLTNQLAAMPSLHVGWTVWVAWALWRHTGRAGRALSCAYVLGTTFVVVATGNHWLLDAVAGACVVGAGVWLSGLAQPHRDRRDPAPASTHRALARGNGANAGSRSRPGILDSCLSTEQAQTGNRPPDAGFPPTPGVSARSGR